MSIIVEQLPLFFFLIYPIIIWEGGWVSLYPREKVEIIKDIQKLTNIKNRINKKILKCTLLGLEEDYNYFRARNEELDNQIIRLMNKMKG